MKALMIGACLAVLGAPALAQPYDQDQTDPYYDQSQPQPATPAPPPGGYQHGYDQQNGDGRYAPQPDQGDMDEDDNGYGEDQPDQGYGAYQPPPAPPPGQPGFQNYEGGGQDAYRGYQQNYGQYSPQYGYPGAGGGYTLYPPHSGYERGYGQQPLYQSYGGGARYTGRTSGSWRNGEGQSCTWQEMTWQDRAGRPGYRWVPRCR